MEKTTPDRETVRKSDRSDRIRWSVWLTGGIFLMLFVVFTTFSVLLLWI